MRVFACKREYVHVGACICAHVKVCASVHCCVCDMCVHVRVHVCMRLCVCTHAQKAENILSVHPCLHLELLLELFISPACCWNNTSLNSPSSSLPKDLVSLRPSYLCMPGLAISSTITGGFGVLYDSPPLPIMSDRC